MLMVLATLVLIFVGGRFADDMLGFIGIGRTARSIWSLIRWPLAVAVAMLAFAGVYYVTPDVKQRAFRAVTSGRGRRVHALAGRVVRVLDLRVEGRRRRRALRRVRRRDRPGRRGCGSRTSRCCSARS